MVEMDGISGQHEKCWLPLHQQRQLWEHLAIAFRPTTKQTLHTALGAMTPPQTTNVRPTNQKTGQRSHSYKKNKQENNMTAVLRRSISISCTKHFLKNVHVAVASRQQMMSMFFLLTFQTIPPIHLRKLRNIQDETKLPVRWARWLGKNLKCRSPLYTTCNLLQTTQKQYFNYYFTLFPFSIMTQIWKKLYLLIYCPFSNSPPFSTSRIQKPSVNKLQLALPVFISYCPL